MRLLLSLSLVLSLAACSGAPAYDRGDAAEGSEIGFAERGRLGSGDATYGDQYVDGYAIGVAREGALALSVSSGAFDAVIVLIGPSGEAMVVDACEGSADACVRIEAPARGQWYARVTSATPGASGGYTLAVGAPLTGMVTAQTLTSRDTPLLPLRRAPEAELEAETAPEPLAEATISESGSYAQDPLAVPYAPERAITPDQELVGTLSSANATIRVDGRSYPSVRVPLRVLYGEIITSEVYSDDTAPLLVLVRDGEPVEVGRPETTSSSTRAGIEYQNAEMGQYAELELHIATADGARSGAYTGYIEIIREPTYYGGGYYVDEDTFVELVPLDIPEPSASYSQTDALRTLLGASPSFRAVRGEVLSRAAGETIYAATAPIPYALTTQVRCRGEACALYAVFPNESAGWAEDQAEDVMDAIEAASGGSVRRVTLREIPETEFDDAIVTSAALTSSAFRAEVTFHPDRYDSLLGVPVILRIEGR